MTTTRRPVGQMEITDENDDEQQPYIDTGIIDLPAKKKARKRLVPANASRIIQKPRRRKQNRYEKTFGRHLLTKRQKSKSWDFLFIPKRLFQRKVRNELKSKEFANDQRVIRSAMAGLQAAYEGYLTLLLQDGTLAAHHANRMTLMNKDITLVARIRRDEDKFVQSTGHHTIKGSQNVIKHFYTRKRLERNKKKSKK